MKEALSPIFIVGAPRSGTTLTARILGRHSRIFMPGETHFFDDIYARRGELGDLSDAESNGKVLGRLRTIYQRYDEHLDQLRIDKLLQTVDATEALGSCRSYKEMFSAFMELQMRSVGKMRWGNNVPKDIFHIEDIFSFYPDAKFFVCVRDVRDFLLSYKNKWRNTGEENADRVRKLYHPVVTSLLWKASAKKIRGIKDTFPSDNVMIVCYEKLVSKPEQLIREMCRFVGEIFEENMLNIKDANSSFQVDEKGIYSSSVGRWRSLLTNEEVYVAQKIVGDHLGEFGYAPAMVEVSRLRVGFIFATLPYGLWKALRANREIRGPLLPYAFKRLAAFSRISTKRNTAKFSQDIDISSVRRSQ